MVLTAQAVSFLRDVKSVVSATPTDFVALYQPTVVNTERYLFNVWPSSDEQSSQEAVTALLSAVFEKALAALKIRRGLMLPIGADTETCYQQQDVWTYAVFTASFFKALEEAFCSDDRFSKFFSEPFPDSPFEIIALAQQRLPVSGLVWLQ